VVSRRLRAEVNSFLVAVSADQVKIWPLHALQVVNKCIKPLVAGPKVNRAVVSAQRLESYKQSDDEVAAALAAPARAKRESNASSILVYPSERAKRVIKKPARYE
jgi:hypothetical protein